jgi:ATP-dependent RNA helicase SUPV3L1/SUV3
MLKGLCAICRSTHPRIPSSSRLPPIRSISTTLPLLRASRKFVVQPDNHIPFRFNRKKSKDAPRLSTKDYTIRPPPTSLAIVKTLLGRVPEWIGSDRTGSKLSAYGLSASQAREALLHWQEELEEVLGNCTDVDTAQKGLERGGWDISRLTDGLQSPEWVAVFEASLLRNFLSRLVASPPPSISTSTITHLSSILDVTDLTQLPFIHDNLPARSLQRHFHLHIGPTNSGKTYSALKALALAPSGAYAGPLRLLAHEVWERLNLGTVGGLDGVGRACNLITGEERRIVNEETGLISCTVEMLPIANMGGDPFDVVVIDEIQMMGDMQRGGSWTKAVLQTKAKEIHLCGDDTTVGLLEKLIPSLGDKMTIHRYERLTPLEVAEESLDGDWNNVEPGDCIVTFSRTNIFAVKKMVETIAGKKCAVVYGALPPETRAEQAREFNEGRAEVLVASDAVGMGLNL